MEEVVILLADDDPGHVSLIRKNLKRAGIMNEIKQFDDGQEILDFLFKKEQEPNLIPGTGYLVLLDIRMPRVDGIEVLKRIKEDEELKSIPIIMITTTDNPIEIKQCHKLGCNSYITKPVHYDKFVEAIRQLGLFLSVVKVPKVYE